MGNRDVPQRTTTGVTRSCPPRSPSHQVIQMSVTFDVSAWPPSTRLPTPIVAAIIVPGPTARLANLATPEGVSKVAEPPDHLSSSHAVRTASSVLPAAIAKDEAGEPNVVALAKNAPIAIAGHMRIPHSSKAASANPLGGHTGLALGCSDASASPSLASKKYASARTTSPSARSPRRDQFSGSARTIFLPPVKLA